MTNPQFHQAAKRLREQFDSNAVIVVSIDRWGMPTVAGVVHPSVEPSSDVEKAIQELIGKIIDLSVGVI